MKAHIVGFVMLVALLCSVSLAAAITIDGNFEDWADVAATVDDAQDMADSSGDIKMIQAAYADGMLYLRMTVHGTIAPAIDQTPAGMTNRYYYHWILDTDDDVSTGFSNSEYEETPTNVSPIGVDVIVMVGWRDGNPNGVEAYDPLTEEMFAEDFEFAVGGDSMEAAIPLDAIGAEYGDVISVSAFQEGASDDWSVDWLDPTTLVLEDVSTAVDSSGKLATTWSQLRTH